MTAQTVKKVDNFNIAIGIENKGRSEVAEKLSCLLASTYMLYLKSLYYHWNVTGENFVGLHELFEKQYIELHEAGDELAERVRALGHFTPGTLKEFQEMSMVKDDEKLPSTANKMVSNLLKANEECSQQARVVLEVAQKADDEVTADMMVDRMASHDKVAWMLRAILQ